MVVDFNNTIYYLLLYCIVIFNIDKLQVTCLEWVSGSTGRGGRQSDWGTPSWSTDWPSTPHTPATVATTPAPHPRDSLTPSPYTSGVCTAQFFFFAYFIQFIQYSINILVIGFGVPLSSSITNYPIIFIHFLGVNCPPIRPAEDPSSRPPGRPPLLTHSPPGATALNTELTFACRPGSTLVGHRTTRCLPSGHWSHPTPTCRSESRTHSWYQV